MNSDSCTRAARRLALQAVVALGMSALLAVSLRASLNPVEGEAAYDAAAWVRDLLRLVGAGLVVPALVLRTLAAINESE